MGKAAKQKRNKERKQTYIARTAKMVIRRESDDKTIEVDNSDPKSVKEGELFCKGTDGYVKTIRSR